MLIGDKDGVWVRLDISLRGPVKLHMPRASFEKLATALSERGNLDAGDLPIDLDWNEVINQVEGEIEDAEICKAPGARSSR